MIQEDKDNDKEKDGNEDENNNVIPKIIITSDGAFIEIQ